MIVNCRDCKKTTEVLHFTSPVRPLQEKGWYVVNVRFDRSRQKASILCVCPECVRRVRRLQGYRVNGHSG